MKAENLNILLSNTAVGQILRSRAENHDKVSTQVAELLWRKSTFCNIFFLPQREDYTARVPLKVWLWRCSSLDGLILLWEILSWLLLTWRDIYIGPMCVNKWTHWHRHWTANIEKTAVAGQKPSREQAFQWNKMFCILSRVVGYFPLTINLLIISSVELFSIVKWKNMYHNF